MIRIVESEEDILRLEQLRLKCTRSSRIIHTPTQTLYGDKLLEKEFIGLSLEKDNKMIAGCILSDHIENLYIEWIFTDPDYRKKGYATKILKYLENNIDMFNEYYSEEFKGIQLEPYISVEGFYRKNGYKDKDNGMIKVLKS